MLLAVLSVLRLTKQLHVDWPCNIFGSGFLFLQIHYTQFSETLPSPSLPSYRTEQAMSDLQKILLSSFPQKMNLDVIL